MHVQLPSSLRNGLLCRCPRCGQGHLFSGYLKLARSCDVCDLSFDFADPADGPAFFVMSGVSILVVGVWAIWAAVAQPPVWAQFAVVIPAILVACLGTLRPMKAWLVAEQYVHKAEEARFSDLGAHGSGDFCWDRRAESMRRAAVH